jgi:iron complex transport system ATP-binding protein
MSALLAFRSARLTIRNRTIVGELDFTVNPGERVALIGPNGAGKTTILRAVLGFLLPAEGDVRLIGDDPARLGASVRARRAAYLPQRATAAWPIKVEALAALGRFAYGAPLGRLRNADRAAVERAMESADVARLRGRALDALSGGEQARAHLARALAQEARVLLLDEPTANLDPAQSARVADIISAQPAHSAVILATHDFTTVLRAATRALVVADGRILVDASPREALASAILKRAFDRDGRIVETEAGPCVVFA